MIVVIGRARAAAGRRPDLVRAVSEVAALTRDDEGCVSYGFYADLHDADLVVGLEVWRDQASLDLHLDHPHTQDFLAAVGDLVDGAPEMTVLADPVPPTRSTDPTRMESR